MMMRSQIPAREEERVPLHNKEANKTQVMNRAAVQPGTVQLQKKITLKAGTVGMTTGGIACSWTSEWTMILATTITDLVQQVMNLPMASEMNNNARFISSKNKTSLPISCFTFKLQIILQSGKAFEAARIIRVS